MREPLRDKERLEHIKAAIDRILRYTSDKSYEDLVASETSIINYTLNRMAYGLR